MNAADLFCSSANVDSVQPVEVPHGSVLWPQFVPYEPELSGEPITTLQALQFVAVFGESATPVGLPNGSALRAVFVLGHPARDPSAAFEDCGFVTSGGWPYEDRTGLLIDARGWSREDVLATAASLWRQAYECYAVYLASETAMRLSEVSEQIVDFRVQFGTSRFVLVSDAPVSEADWDACVIPALGKLARGFCTKPLVNPLARRWLAEHLQALKVETPERPTIVVPTGLFEVWRPRRRAARPRDPDQYRAQVGQCPDGYHFDAQTRRCVRTGQHVAPIATTPHAVVASRHPRLRKALGHTVGMVVEPFHAAWNLARKPEARKALRTKIVGAVKKEGRETKALLGTIGKAMRGQKVTVQERNAAIAQTADLVKVAFISYAVGHVFAAGVVKALATLASPADEMVGIAIDKPLRALTAKVFGVAHGILPTAFYESADDPASVLMRIVDAILNRLGTLPLDDEDILDALVHGGLTPENAVRLQAQLREGVDDPHVLKAVFLAGGGGSGKSWVAQKAFADTGLRLVSRDQSFEFLMRQFGLDLKRDIDSDFAQDKLRPHARALAHARQDALTIGRVGLLIDGTGIFPGDLLHRRDRLEDLGYDTYMVFVSSSVKTALRRNRERERTVPSDAVRDAHRSAKEAKVTYRAEFGAHFVEVRNEEDFDDETVRARIVPTLARLAMRLIGGSVENPIGRKWLADQRMGGRPKRLAAGVGDGG